MDVEEFKQKYEELKDNPMYKNFCSILDTKSQVLERIAKENQKLKKQLEYLHGEEYLNQLRFERNMLQDIVDKMEVSKEDKRFIDMTHRNTQLLEENQELKEQLEVGKEQYNDLVEEKENLQEQLSNSRQIKNQQKEFIKWLETEIKNYELPLTDENKKALGYTLPMKEIYKEVLEKYKELIGVKDE